jgi:hypothetical protein
MATTVIRWDLQGEDALLEMVRGRLTELEPGFGGRVRFAFAGGPGRWILLRIDLAEGERSLGGSGPLLAAVSRQMAPWVRHRSDDRSGGLQLSLRAGDEGHPHLLPHLADGLALGLSSELGQRFSFPCRGDTYEERDLTHPAGMGRGALGQLLAPTGLAGLAEAFCRAEQAAGINALALTALAAWQSAWGLSRIAREQKNPLAWGAGPDAPTFATAADGVAVVAGLIRRQYLNPEGAFYHGPNLIGMNVAYAHDPTWRHGVAAIWRQLEEHGKAQEPEG